MLRADRREGPSWSFSHTAFMAVWKMKLELEEAEDVDVDTV